MFFIGIRSPAVNKSAHTPNTQAVIFVRSLNSSVSVDPHTNRFTKSTMPVPWVILMSQRKRNFNVLKYAAVLKTKKVLPDNFTRILPNYLVTLGCFQTSGIFQNIKIYFSLWHQNGSRHTWICKAICMWFYWNTWFQAPDKNNSMYFGCLCTFIDCWWSYTTKKHFMWVCSDSDRSRLFLQLSSLQVNNKYVTSTGCPNKF